MSHLNTNSNHSKYYDWAHTLTYSGALITMVISARGYGKTYGIRKQAIKDFLKDGSRFVEVVRYKSELEGDDKIQRDYFSKLQQKNEFPNYIFKTEGTIAYIADGRKEKPDWQVIGYFVPLSSMQRSKKRTFVNVRKVIFDEFVIDRRTRARYLQGEVGLFINLIDSLARQEVGTDTKVRAYLLGNACDLGNPYFIHYGINTIPEEGYKWYHDKDVLLHYCINKEYQEGKKETLVGRLVAGTKEEQIIVNNEFQIADEYNIAKKTPQAKYTFGVIYRDFQFGIWRDDRAGYYYITSKTLPPESGFILALTREDNTPNTLMIRKNDHRLKTLTDLYYYDVLRFESVQTRENFLNVLASFNLL